MGKMASNKFLGIAIFWEVFRVLNIVFW